jgi:bisphosphoglycerate-dependent phosphoglycerate mutase
VLFDRIYHDSVILMVVIGLSKNATAERLGAPVVQAWRNSLKARPPPLPHTHPASPANDRRYADLPRDQIPVSERLLDAHERARPLWDHRLKYDIANGHTVLVVAHRDALRGIMQAIDCLDPEQTLKVAVPTGVPVVYRFDAQLKPLPPEGDHPAHTSGVFLEKPGVLAEALERHEDWKNTFDHGPIVGDRESTVERALQQLRREEQLLVQGSKSETTTTAPPLGERWADDVREFEEFEFFNDGWEEENIIPLTIVPASEDYYPPKDDPVIVFVRHGRTPHNNLGLFTGFQDPPYVLWSRVCVFWGPS